MLLKRFICCSLLLLAGVNAFAQQKNTIVATDYPQDYFRNPLDIPIFLAGNFGECRPGHFHSGIDIKTKGEENQPVHAAAEGYISRIKMEKGGFGHGLYITHPNGYTTLYAHLNDFAPAIQQYVRHQQYEKQQWNIDLQLSASQFPVKKGQIIASSGNTGASTAPHLHFEIRNTKTEHPLNPELFGLPIVDNIAPVPVEVAFYQYYGREHNRDNVPISIYDGFYRRAGISLTKKEGIYRPLKVDNIANSKGYKIIKDTVYVPDGIIGLGIQAGDYMEGSDNILTFYKAKLFLDDSLQSEITLDDIGYDETRYINGYVDYGARVESNKWIQCLFKLHGNKLDRIFSKLNKQNGRLTIPLGSVHKVEIVLIDDAGNKSPINFYAKGVDIRDNLYRDQLFEFFFADSVNTFNDRDYPNVTFTLDNRQLYDNIYFEFRSESNIKGYSDKYKIHDPNTPLHHYFDLKIKPNRPVPFDLRSKMTLMYSDGKDEEGSVAVPVDDGWYKAPARAFGTYWLDADTIPPVIKTGQKQGAILSKAKQITIDVKDAQTSVKKFNGYIDDKWVCFEQHGSSFFYKFDEHCSKGKHKLLFKAEDENANSATYTLTFTR